MADQNGEASGGQAAEEQAPKRDYVVSGPETQADKAEKERLAAEGQKAEKEPADEDGSDEDGDEGEDDDQPKGDKAKKPRRGGFQKKIAKLEAELAAIRAEKTGGKQDDPPAKDAPKAAEKPKPEDFTTYDDYIEALTDWKTDQRIEKRENDRRTEAKASEFKKSQQTKVQRYEEGIEAVKEMEGYEDFDEVIEEYDGPLTIGMQQALLDSEIGPQVAYYLAKNPDEAERISKLNLIEMNKAIGKIEARLEKSSQKGEGDEGKATKVAKTTKAPPPINPVKGSAKSKKDPDDQSYEEYLQDRQKRRGS